MRLFYALELDAGARTTIETWRANALPPIGRAVPAANFHITLLYLGEVGERDLEKLLHETDRLQAPSVSLCLDKSGYFPRPKVYWVGSETVPAPLLSLVKDLKRCARKVGLKVDKRPYTPHVTLFRKCAARPPLPAHDISLDLSFTGFTLYESVSGNAGVRYEPVASW